MMTLEEKLEVIRAYAEGKPIEVYNEDEDVWEAKIYDDWNFEEGKYRIKPEATAKFKVGDTLVSIGAAEVQNPIKYKIMGVQQDYYKFDCVSPRPVEEVDEKFINITEVLWYFEIYDYVSKKYAMHPTRMTMNEMDEELASNHDTLSWKPIYALGFKLKEN